MLTEEQPLIAVLIVDLCTSGKQIVAQIRSAVEFWIEISQLGRIEWVDIWEAYEYSLLLLQDVVCVAHNIISEEVLGVDLTLACLITAILMRLCRSCWIYEHNSQ